MRAWRIHEYGGPDKLVLDIMPVPFPEEGELLVKVAAASVNPVDLKIREGHLKGALALKFPRVLGCDCAGTVLESRSADFRPGDRVLAMGDRTKRDGTHAEYALVPAPQSARLPAGLSETDAVAFGVAGLSAWIPLVEIAEIGLGKRVLIHAGAGGVGSVAIQLARHFGAAVFTTCGPANLEFVKSLGAHRAIDYTREDFVQAASPCDMVFDTVGGETHKRSFGALKPGGLIVRISAAPVDPAPPRQDVRSVLAQIRYTTDRFAKILELAGRGVIKAQVGRIFPFSEAPAAYSAVQSGHARGKMVIKVG